MSGCAGMATFGLRTKYLKNNIHVWVCAVREWQPSTYVKKIFKSNNHVWVCGKGNLQIM
jgi:hypothetical protein